MKLKTNLARIILVLAMLFLPTSTALAQSPGEDIVLFGQNYTLESEDSLDGSLAVFGGNVSVEENSKINGDVALIGGNLSLLGNVDGDVALIGGNLTISGTINGDIVIVGGQARLSETAVVNGDISTIGGNVEKEPGAEVNGNITNNAPPTIDAPNIPNVPNVPEAPGVPESPNVDLRVNPFLNVGGKLGQAVLVALVGMLLTLFLQPQLDRAGISMTSQPIIAGGYGLLAFILVPIAAVIMAITIILIPVSLLVIFLVMPAVWLFGTVALGQEVGDRFTKAINQTWAPVLSTGFGTFLLVLVTGLVGLIPCVGWLPSFVVTLIAIGGVAMTWFGTRNAPNLPPSQVPPAS